MEFTREIQGSNTYLVYQIKPQDEIDTVGLGMIINNKIEGIVSTISNQMDRQKFLKYNISAKVELKQFFYETVNREQLLCVFASILEGLVEAEDYMLERETLLLHPDYIFVDVSTGKAALVCVPIIKQQEEQKSLETFFKEIMFSVQFNQSENGDYIAKIIGYLNRTKQISVPDFLHLIKTLQEPAPKPQQGGQTKPVIQRPVQVPKAPSPEVENIEQPQNTVQPVAAKPPENPIQPQNTVLQKEQPQMGFEIPGGSAAPLEAETKKGKKKKEKLPKEKQKKEKPPKEKKSFPLLFGKKKKEESQESVPQPEMAFEMPQVQPVQPPENAPVAPPVTIEAGGNNHQIPIPPQSSNFGETRVLRNSNFGETEVLSNLNPDARPNPCLIRVRNQQQVTINKPVFRIGKEPNYVDYCIGDNPAVSRSHANIFRKEDGYYIEDTNSANHTYVNGEIVVSGSAVKLESGTRIRLANEEFVFQY